MNNTVGECNEHSHVSTISKQANDGNGRNSPKDDKKGIYSFATGVSAELPIDDDEDDDDDENATKTAVQVGNDYEEMEEQEDEAEQMSDLRKRKI